MADEANLALLLIRVVIGVTMVLHGQQKLRNLSGTAGWFDSIGMRPGRAHAVLAGGGEVASGICLAVGLLTTFGALGFVGPMTVAGWVDHRDKGFFILKQGWEYVLVLATAAVAIAMLGPGEWSVDDGLGIADDLDGWAGLAIAAGGGLAAAITLLAVFYRPPAPSE